MPNNTIPKRNLPLWKALFPMILLIVLLFFNVVFVFGDDALSGSNQFILLFVAAIAAIIGITEKVSYSEIIDQVKKQISITSEALLILLMVGALTGTWLSSGVIPTMVYYGLELLNAKIFLVACVFISIIVSLATGSSWTTSATIGVALIGISKTLGIPIGMTAGAILSGAYFGDKLSPLSDTTNLAASIAGTDLYTHIKYMLWTTIPSIVISILFFIILGLTLETPESITSNAFEADIKSAFNVSGWLLLVPLFVFFLIVKKVPAIVSLLAGSLLGGIVTCIAQPQVILQVTQATSINLVSAYQTVLTALTNDITIPTENPLLQDLFSAGGMQGMLGTIWLIICAMVLGGTLQAIGALSTLSSAILKIAKGATGLIASTTGITILTNVTASDQYLSIVVPGKMFKNAYKDQKLAPENLSRTLEDSGTVTSALIPWNTCGAFHSKTLGVDVADYAFFAIFNWLSPFMTLIFAVFKIKIRQLIAPKS
ncbi:Na+/H+ antiporter NhaC [Aquimarina agarivorans]|uniref:Na+/H+ antiporter NhaC n=1 Tax=Aquimarina agarivorans TaxID=980584 RepID=UPI000248F003|nr:Na+/H+ antiporter NhaC [Aquimarina agarivorans]